MVASYIIIMLWVCGMQAKSICIIYMHSYSYRADRISVDSAPAMQAAWCNLLESDSHSATYKLYAGHAYAVNAMMNLKLFYPAAYML